MKLHALIFSTTLIACASMHGMNQSRMVANPHTKQSQIDDSIAEIEEIEPVCKAAQGDRIPAEGLTNIKQDSSSNKN